MQIIKSLQMRGKTNVNYHNICCLSKRINQEMLHSMFAFYSELHTKTKFIDSLNSFFKNQLMQYR